MFERIREARRNEKGFTLIELLIVIVILGVLAGIVVFAVGAFNNDGVSAACKSDKKNVEIAVEAYKAKNTAYPTDITDAKAKLVPNYLKEWPDGGTNYTITYSLTTGNPPVIGPSSCG